MAWRSWLVWMAILCWLSAQYLACMDYPLLAEDHTELHAMRPFASVVEVFTTDHPPPRPLQHLVFYAGTHWTSIEPWAMRLPGFLVHLLAIVGAGRLARALGFGSGTALATSLLYAAFPATHAIVYPASLGAVGRTAFGLWSLVFFVTSERRPLAAIPAIACATIALLFHQSATTLAAMFPLFAVLACRGPIEHLVPCIRRQLANPTWAGFLVVLALFFWAHRDADSPHTSLRSLASIAGNGVKGLFAVAPEDLRFPVVEAMRGHYGSFGFVLGLGAVLAVVTGFGIAVVRSGRVLRFLLLAIACDLLLPISTAGFSQRYALLAGALFAIAAVSKSLSATRYRPFVLLLGLLWGFDTVRSTLEAREAGHTVARLLEVGARERASLPVGCRLVVADLPLTWGREKDLMVLHWGFSEALSDRGVGGAFDLEYVRTQTFPGETRAKLVAPTELERLRHDPNIVLLEYEPLARTFVVFRRGVREDAKPR